MTRKRGTDTKNPKNSGNRRIWTIVSGSLLILLAAGFALGVHCGEERSSGGEFVFVEGGTFWMGSSAEGLYEQPEHEVYVDSFYISPCEVSFAEFDAFCDATGRPRTSLENSSITTRSRDTMPAVYVSWYDAVEYCNWKSEQDGLTKCYAIDKTAVDPNNAADLDDCKWIVECNFEADGYRLPTEAEWEYAARGGQRSRGSTYSGTSSLEELHQYAYYLVNSPDGPHDASGEGMEANELGLYHMSGNASEWCWDWFGREYYGTSPDDNPTGPESGEWRVKRGGSWASFPQDLRVSSRGFGFPNLRADNGAGFRLVKSN